MEHVTNEPGQQADPEQHADSVPHTPPQGDAETTPGRGRRRLWIAAVAAMVVTAGVVFALVRVFDSSSARSEEAKETVQEYLLALRTSDAAQARTYLGDPLGAIEGMDPWPALSREILEASNDIAPMGDFEVLEPREVGSNYFEVPVQLDIGGKHFERTFNVNTKDGAVITDGLVSVDSRALSASGLRVNGETVPERFVELFPGAYVFDAKFEAFELPGASDPMILVDDDDAAGFEEATRPVLTTEGKAQFRDLVRDSFEECISWEYGEPECGLEAILTSEDYDSRGSDRTVRRSLAPDVQEQILTAINTLEPVESPDTSGVYGIELPPVDPEADVTVTIQREGEQARSVVIPVYLDELKNPSVDFTQFVPQLTWK